MSEFIDKFILQHKEYFGRNRTQILNNRWNNTDYYEGRLENFTNELILLNQSDDKDKEKKIRSLESEIRKFVETSKNTKKKLFQQENKLTNSILGRLSAFINEASSDRHLKKTQDFIDSTVEIIDIHLKKCRDYLNYNSDVLTKEVTTDDEIEFNNIETDFQDDIFGEKIKIENTLNSLNINNSSDNLQIRLFKDQKASLLMRTPLCLKIPDVDDITKNLNVTWDVSNSTEMLKNMNPKDIPKFNPKKHYWEQDSVVLQFWQEEVIKITHGITINGYFIHPFLYWHLNIFKTPIPQKDGTEPIINPYWRDNELFFVENLKKCEDAKDKGMLLYGTRRWTKSVLLASYTQWKSHTKFNSIATVTGGSEGDLTDLTDKIQTSIVYMPHALKLEVQKQEWGGGDTILGLKEDASNSIKHSIIRVKNFSAGAKTSTQKAAGGGPSAFVNDEIGKYDFLKSYLAALPSFETVHGFKCVPILAGTAGESDLSKDAMTVLSQPEKYNLLSMDWDLLKNWIDPDAISFKPRNFSLFLPAQMAYKTGFVKLEKPAGEFLGIKNATELNKNVLQYTDWKGNLEKLQDWRKEAKGDALLLQQRTVQYPIDPEECFLSSEKNIFNYEEAMRRKEYLEQTGEGDRRFELYRDYDGKIKKKPSNKPLAEYPHKGGNIDAPYLLFEDPPEEKQPLYTYVAGGDMYKQESSDTDSVGTIYIYKYDLFGDKWAYRLVASYSARPNTFNEFYKNCLMLLEAYNAVLFPENEDLGGFQSFLEKQHLEDYYLMPHIDFTSTLEFSINGRRRFGWTAAQSKRKLLNMFANYTKEDVKIINELGEEISMERIHTINDIHLLTEMINYTKDGNFDRITASAGSIGFLHYLEKNYITPKRFISQKNIEQKISQRERNPYGTSNVRAKNPYSRRR